MNILFSDKTGTITKGNLSVVEFLLGDGKIVKDVASIKRIATTANVIASLPLTSVSTTSSIPAVSSRILTW